MRNKIKLVRLVHKSHILSGNKTKDDDKEAYNIINTSSDLDDVEKRIYFTFI